MTELSTQEMSKPTGRVPADFHSLLYEAARLWRARSHYGPGDARLGGLFQRAFQLFRADLDRHGSFEVEIDASGLRAGHSDGTHRLNGLSGLHRALAERGATELRFENDLEPESFAAIFEVLVLDRDTVEREGGFAWAVYRRAPTGLIVNGVQSTDTPPPIESEAPTPPAPVTDALPAAIPDTLPDVSRPTEAGVARAAESGPAPFPGDAPSFEDFSDQSVSETLLPKAQPVESAPAADLSDTRRGSVWDHVPTAEPEAPATSMTESITGRMEMADGRLPPDESLDALFDTLPEYGDGGAPEAIEELLTEPDFSHSRRGDTTLGLRGATQQASSAWDPNAATDPTDALPGGLDGGADLLTEPGASGADLLTEPGASGADLLTEPVASGADLLTEPEASGADLLTEPEASGADLLAEPEAYGAEAPSDGSGPGADLYPEDTEPLSLDLDPGLSGEHGATALPADGASLFDRTSDLGSDPVANSGTSELGADPDTGGTEPLRRQAVEDPSESARVSAREHTEPASGEPPTGLEEVEPGEPALVTNHVAEVSAIDPPVTSDDVSAIDPSVASDDVSAIDPSVASDDVSAIDPSVALDDVAAINPSVALENVSATDPSVASDDVSAIDSSTSPAVAEEAAQRFAEPATAEDSDMPGFEERLAILEDADTAAYRAELEAVLYGLANEGVEEKDALALVLARHVREGRDGLAGEDSLRGLTSLADVDSIERWLRCAIEDGGDPDTAFGGILTLLSERTAPALLIELGKERDLEARNAAGRLFRGIGEAARDMLARRLNQDDPASLLAVTRLIRELGLPAPVSGLSTLLEHDQGAIREEAANALASVGDPEAVHALRGALMHGRPDTQPKAAIALGRCEAGGVTETLHEALEAFVEGDSAELTREIIFALGKRGEESAAAPLADILQRKKRFGGRRLRELKLAAAGALAKIPGDAAAAALTQLAQVRDTQLRRAAELSLARRESWLTSGDDEDRDTDVS